MEKNTSKIKFIEIKKEIINSGDNCIKVNDLTIKNNHSYCISDKNMVVHNCTTYPSTGFGSRNCQASIVYQCSLCTNIPIIADGGIKVPGDISKSLVLGATMVMVGGMLSGLQDSPGQIVEINGKNYKEFWGSASSFQSGKKNRIEGKKNLIELKGKSILEEMVHLEECLQSSISYGGGNNLESLKKVKWV